MEFADPIPMTEAEWAGLYEATTRADIMLLQNQVLTADELRSMRFNAGTWSATAAPIPERTVSDPTASAELRAAILGTMATEQTAEPAQPEAPAETATTDPAAEQTAASAAVAAAEQIPVGFVSAAKELAIEVYAGRMAPDPARAILEMINVPAHLAARIAPDVPAAVVLPPPPTTTTGEPATVDPAQTAEDAENYIPPEGAQGNARKVLKWRDEHGDEVEGMTRVGWTRANQLAEGSPVSREVVGKMAAFERHRKNYEAAAARVRSGESDPWTEPAYVAWLGWGGDTGIAWAQERVRAEDAAQDASPLSALVALIPDAPTVEALASVREAVAAIVPDLDPETWPHLTVLYAGDIPQSRVRSLRGTVAERLPDLSGDIDGDLTVKGLEVWPDGERSAIVLRVGGAGLTRAHNVLWGALTPLMTAQQHPTYKAHVTIGYVQGALAPDTMEALQALALPETVNMGEAILRHGERQLLAVNMTR
jgi:2'-5' RNA ligase